MRPLRIDAREEHLLEHPLDQILLGREIPVEQRLRDVEALRQLARVAGEADFGEEAHRLGQDLLLAVGRGEALGGFASAHATARRGGGTVPPSARNGASARRDMVGAGYRRLPDGGITGSST